MSLGNSPAGRCSGGHFYYVRAGVPFPSWCLLVFGLGVPGRLVLLTSADVVPDLVAGWLVHEVIVVVEEVPVSLEHPITPPQEELEPIDLLNMPQYRIISVSPNPFNPSTEISFETQVRDRMDLEIYNVAGKHVQTKRLGILQPGQHAVHWDGRDAKGEEVDSGVYFLRIRGIRGESSAARTILVR